MRIPSRATSTAWSSTCRRSTRQEPAIIDQRPDSFRGRRPIDVIAATRPILIIDEPQSVEGRQTRESLRKFNALFTLRYSATHREAYNMVYRLTPWTPITGIW